MNAVVQHQGEPQSEATALIQAIERAAINPAVDVDKMERLLQMQERILARNAEVAFNAAFAEMQSELPIITEKGEIKVGHEVRSKYAKFEDMNEVVKPILHKHGFGISFRTDFSDGITITAVLSHRQGHREQTSMKLPADTSGSKNVVQAIGSSVSYGKRYTMEAVLNITSRGQDDDGRAGGAGDTITEKQAMDLQALAEEVKANREQFLKYFGIDSLRDLPAKRYNDAVAALNKKRKQA